jgi:hypothetical protein
LAADGEGMGDHSDLPICRKILQLGRLNEQSHPLQQLDEVIEDIIRLMVESTETASEEKLSRRKENSSRSKASNNAGRWSDEQLQNLFGIQEDFHS